MAKYEGKIGYAVTEEYPLGSGIWVERIVERHYFGDYERRSIRRQNGAYLNDDLVPSATISILADAYAYQNFSHIKYAEWMGVKWKVSLVEPERPRLTLTLGGVYNGQ